MATVLTPSPKQKFFDNNGNPLANGLLFVYSAGTTTKATTYTDSGGGTANSNPIVLDFRGECNLWIDPNVSYKYVLAPANDTDPPTNPIWTVDNLVSSQLITLYGGVDTGIANAYVLNFTANFTAYTDGIIVYWIPSNSSNGTGAAININGIGVVQLVNNDGSAITTGIIPANQMIGIIYRSGKFYLLSSPMLAGSFTATLTGMTATVTGTMYYRIVNNICSLHTQGSAITGTSNQTFCGITGIPQITCPSFGNTVAMCDLTDNGISKLGYASISSTGISLSLLAVSGATIVKGGLFTNSGTKGIGANDWSITYPIW